MRIFIIGAETNLDALGQQLLRRPSAASTTLDQVEALNPQVDFRRLKPGTVLLLPDAPDLKAGAGTALGSEDLKSLLEAIDAGLAAAAKRLRAGFQQLDTDRTAMASALKGAAAARVVASDPALKQQIQAADAQFKADQKRGTDTQAQFAEMQKLAAKEFARLQTMLGQ